MTNKKEKVGNAFCHIYLIVLSLIAVFPLVWVLLCSVKSSGELTSNPTRFFPKHFTLENFTHVIQDLGFAKNIGNSLIIAIITTGIAIVISSMAAYGIVRFFPKTTYADNIFYAGDATKSNYFRIPSLLTLDSGTVIAAADARYGGTHDSKSKINTAFAKSTDGGNTWGEPTLPMKFDDYVAKNIDWPRDSVGKNVQIQGSASYIDPVLLEDHESYFSYKSPTLPSGSSVKHE